MPWLESGVIGPPKNVGTGKDGSHHCIHRDTCCEWVGATNSASGAKMVSASVAFRVENK
jgi:hypothetical protein